MNKVFTVDQTVCLKPGVNTSRYNKEVVEGTVKTVGRKYITVTLGWQEYKFNKDDLRQVTKFAAGYYLYENKQDILDEEESLQIVEYIRKKIGSYGFVNISLGTLRKIKELIESD